MPIYRFDKIGPRLADEIAEALVRRESAALLGGRNVGKRRAVRLVYERLRSAGKEVALATLLNVDEEVDPRGKGQDRFLGDIPAVMREPEEILNWWCGHASGGFLLISNVDAMPAGAHRLFRRELRAIGLNGVLLTCEAIGASAFVGPSPTLLVDTVHVVASWEREEFDRFAQRYLGRLGLGNGDLAPVMTKLYERTAGNVYFLRILLWSLFDGWASREDHEAKSLSPDDIPDAALAAQIPWNHYLRHVSRMIAHEPNCWPRLERLLECGEVDAPPELDLLELTGLLVRERTASGDRLRLPRHLIGGFLRKHYTSRKLADLYAGEGNWDEAFRKLNELSPEDRVRPTDLNDFADAEVMVKRLSAFLYQEAVRGVDGLAAVRRRFREGCTLLLGFSKVNYYCRFPQKTAVWQPLDADESLPIPEKAIGNGPVSKSFESEPDLVVYAVPDEEELSLFAAPIASGHCDRKAAVVVVGSREEQRRASAGRMSLLRELFRDFATAYTHAWEVANLRSRAQRRSKLDDAVSNIFAGLGKEIVTLSHAVTLAANELRYTAGYQRVLVSLVDAESRRITGFVEASGDEAQTLKNVADYSLDDRSSLHVRAVLERKPIRFVDAVEDPRANSNSVSSAQAVAGVVIPLLTGRNQDDNPFVLGTLAVEPSEPIAPDVDEVADLLHFGQQLAGIIEQAERIQLLQAALDDQRGPLAIFDHSRRLRYANSPAAKMVGEPLSHGWQNPETAPTIGQLADLTGENPIADASQLVERAFDEKNRVVDQLGGPAQYWIGAANVIGQDNNDEIEAEKSDGRPPFGVFCEAQDLTFLARTLQALGDLLDEIASAPVEAADVSFAERVIDGIGRMLATLPGTDVVTFVRYDCGSDQLQFERQFMAGQAKSQSVSPQPHPASGYAVLAFNRSVPLPFYLDVGEFEDGQEVITPVGLEAISIRRYDGVPPDTPDRSLWIEIPLAPAGRRLGKMAVCCPGDYRPDDFLFLQAMTELLSHVSGTLLLLAEAHEKRIKERDEAVHKSLEDFAHQVKQPLKSTGILFDKLAKSDPGDAGFRTLLARLERSIYRFSHYADIACKTQSIVQIVPREGDLYEILQDAFNLALDSDCFNVTPAGDAQFTGRFDREHLSLAISELAENARKHSGLGESELSSLRVRALIERFTEDGHIWYRLTVENDGPGIPADDKERIFGRTIRLNPNVEGHGLGLAYVRRVIEEHGGRIAECGVPGKNAKFMIEMPSM